MKQRGNALFLILIAVALFAALSYAVTQSGRGGGSIDRETATLQAAQMAQYASLVSQTVEKLRLINGCQDVDISFEHPSGTNVNTVSTVTDNSCHLFDAAGGGISYQNFPNSDDWFGSGELVVGTLAPPNQRPELTMIFPRIDQDICNELNRSFGINYSGAAPPDGLASLDSEDMFTGTYTNTDGIGTNATTDPILVGEQSFCFLETSTDELFYVTVLISRTGTL